MACTFCATGQFGFERHLQAGEIVAQVAYASAYLRANGLGDVTVASHQHRVHGHG